jgi:hypothetical protein
MRVDRRAKKKSDAPVVLVLGALLAGCDTEANFRAQMNDLAGRSEADLVGRLGAPQHIYMTADGSRILTYVRSETLQPQASQYHPPPPQLAGGIYGGVSVPALGGLFASAEPCRYGHSFLHGQPLDHQRPRGNLALIGDQLRCEITWPAKRGTRRMRSDGHSA